MAADGVEPSRRLQAEGRGERVLHPGARGHGRRAVLHGQPGQRLREPGQLGVEQVQGLAPLQHEPGVQGILAGGAPVHEARGVGIVLRDEGGEAADEGDDGIAGRRRLASQRLDVEVLGPALFRDRRSRRRGDDSGAREGGGEGGLEIQHPLDAGAVGEEIADGRPAEERIEEAHTGTRVIVQMSKNTVSWGPCRTMFQTSSPGWPVRAAIRVERRAGSTRPRAKSLALAASSGKYILVIRRRMSPRAKRDMARWGACGTPRGPGTGPGLMVVNRKRPSGPVGTRP